MAGNLQVTQSKGITGGALNPLTSQYVLVASATQMVDTTLATGGVLTALSVSWSLPGTSAGDILSFFMLAGQPMTIQSNGVGTIGVQTLTMTGTPTGGTFALGYQGQITAPIAYNAAASAVQSALRALSTIGGTNVTCSGGPFPGSAITATFSGSLVLSTVPLITYNLGGLTGGTPAMTIVNAAGTPQDVIQLSANIPYAWDSQNGYAYPLQGAITALYVTNVNAGRLQIGYATY